MISIWKKRLSKSGKPYYKNTLTNESKWKVPNKNGILREFEESNNTFIIYIPDVYLNVKKKNSDSLEFSPTKINIDRKYIDADQTDGDCIKELIEGAYVIYSSILSLPYETTIICGGQSPAYYCLAMMNFSIYNNKRANIIVLPHSKSGQITTYDKVYAENRQYCARLMEKGLKLENNVIIIDSIHSGVGILALESALKHCYPRIKISKYSINDDHHMTVDRKYNFRCQAIFSDYFPRIVNSYPARNFDDSTNFITNFINLDNPIAEMIIDIAKNYPYIKVEDTEWYQLNNIITTEIEAARTKYKIQQEKQKQYQLEKEESIRVEKETALASAKTFEPIITINKYGSEVYECPICKLQTVTSEVRKNNFAHVWNCPNQYRKIILPEPMMGESHPMLWESQPMDVWGSAAPAMGGWESQPMDVWR
jgi:hypothetical protein